VARALAVIDGGRYPMAAVCRARWGWPVRGSPSSTGSALAIGAGGRVAKTAWWMSSCVRSLCSERPTAIAGSGRCCDASGDPKLCHRSRPTRGVRVQAEPVGVSNGRRVSLGKLPLMPVRIGGRHFAGNIQSLHLICRQTPTDGPQILLQLLFVSGTDNHCRYRRTL
jgi:hypothetical protein